MDAVYAAVPASLVGREQEIEVGPMSGQSNVIFWLETPRAAGERRDRRPHLRAPRKRRIARSPTSRCRIVASRLQRPPELATQRHSELQRRPTDERRYLHRCQPCIASRENSEVHRPRIPRLAEPEHRLPADFGQAVRAREVDEQRHALVCCGSWLSAKTARRFTSISGSLLIAFRNRPDGFVAGALRQPEQRLAADARPLIGARQRDQSITRRVARMQGEG